MSVTSIEEEKAKLEAELRELEQYYNSFMSHIVQEPPLHVWDLNDLSEAIETKMPIDVLQGYVDEEVHQRHKEIGDPMKWVKWLLPIAIFIFIVLVGLKVYYTGSGGAVEAVRSGSGIVIGR